MKKIILFLMLCFAPLVSATPLLVKGEMFNSNTYITFEDIALPEGFESYRCYVDFETWIYDLGDAEKYVHRGRTFYRCIEQGILKENEYYNVFFSFEDRPNGDVYYTPRVRIPIVWRF